MKNSEMATKTVAKVEKHVESPERKAYVPPRIRDVDPVGIMYSVLN